MNSRHTFSTCIAAVAAGLALGGCGRNEDPTRGEAVVRSSQAPTEAAGSEVAKAMTDAAITTTINAELARDGALDPTKIDVDTAQGRVVLRGSAPDAEAKERAKRIAMAVSGVKAVDNYLSVSTQS